jgi:hypothetical protein
MYNYLIEEYDVSYLIDLLQKQGTETGDRISNSLISQTKSWYKWEKTQSDFESQEVFTGI